MAGNGSEETEGKVVKKCPFLNAWCKMEVCALWIVVFHQGVNTLGIREVTWEGKCSIPALCEIMSSRPAPAAAQAQVIKMPPQILRG